MSSPHPFASIIMPTYNRADFLDECLPPLFAQTYPRDRYEIILVDDGSTDDTADSAATIAGGWDGRFRLVSKPNGGPASARNAGLEIAEGEFIAFIDSDCIAEPDWLEKMVGGLASSDASAAGGPILAAPDPHWVPTYMTAMSFYRHRSTGGEVDYLITPNAAFRRSALNAVGGFTVRPGTIANDDVSLSFKLKSAGYRLVELEEGAVTHYGTPGSVRALANHLFQYGYSLPIMLVEWNRQRSPIVEIIRHLGAMCLSPLIALTCIPKVGVIKAISFIPLIVIEHGAFAVGVIAALIAKPQGAR